MQINVVDYLVKAAERKPDGIAFSDESGGVTYRELLEMARSLACEISRVTDGALRRPVAVFADRSVSCIVSFMGVLFSGNFYMPLDISMPAPRLMAMLDSVKPAAYILADGQSEEFAAYRTVSYATGIASPADERLLKRAENAIIDIDPAYMMFTSGSTGIPKGVVISHRAVIDLIEWLSDTFGFKDSDVFGNQTPFYFDASVKDIYLTLKHAASMYILPKKLFATPLRLIETLNAKRVNVIMWATSAVGFTANSGILAKLKPEYIEKVFFAGEAMLAKQMNIWRAALPDAMLVNLYGPTEVAVDCSYYIVDREFSDGERIPIGTNCRNMEILLLDGEGQAVGNGETGEIYVRGSGLALGYYGDTLRSDERFVQNPLNPHYRDILYKTGDLARYNAFGELDFAGREDSQIKHLGNRIELGEIEATVNSLPEIEAAACLYDSAGMKIVLVYQGENADRELLAKHLRETLPRYMQPGVYIRKAAIPLTPNGKIDRVKLRKEYEDEAG